MSKNYAFALLYFLLATSKTQFKLFLVDFLSRTFSGAIFLLFCLTSGRHRWPLLIKQKELNYTSGQRWFWCEKRIKGRGSGGGRATAFCPSRPGLNHSTNLGFFRFKIAVHLFSLSIGLFPITC